MILKSSFLILELKNFNALSIVVLSVVGECIVNDLIFKLSHRYLYNKKYVKKKLLDHY